MWGSTRADGDDATFRTRFVNARPEDTVRDQPDKSIRCLGARCFIIIRNRNDDDDDERSDVQTSGGERGKKKEEKKNNAP